MGSTPPERHLNSRDNRPVPQSTTLANRKNEEFGHAARNFFDIIGKIRYGVLPWRMSAVLNVPSCPIS